MKEKTNEDQIRNTALLSFTTMTDRNEDTSGSKESTPALAFSKDTPDSQIWTAEEKRVLQSHIEGYRAAPRKTKSSYVVGKVIPEIKKCWKGRYDKKKTKSDRDLKKEWDKKKNVSIWSLNSETN